MLVTIKKSSINNTSEYPERKVNTFLLPLLQTSRRPCLSTIFLSSQLLYSRDISTINNKQVGIKHVADGKSGEATCSNVIIPNRSTEGTLANTRRPPLVEKKFNTYWCHHIHALKSARYGICILPNTYSHNILRLINVSSIEFSIKILVYFRKPCSTPSSPPSSLFIARHHLISWHQCIVKNSCWIWTKPWDRLISSSYLPHMYSWGTIPIHDN